MIDNYDIFFSDLHIHIVERRKYIIVDRNILNTIKLFDYYFLLIFFFKEIEMFQLRTMTKCNFSNV